MNANRQTKQRKVLRWFWAACTLALLAGGALASEATATPSISRNEIMSRAFSARYQPYGQTGTHVKSYEPDVTHSEPVIDCSGLVQKSWQVPEQIYPGRWDPPTEPTAEYSAAAFATGGTHWYTISSGSLIGGDALSSGNHAVLYVYTGTDWWIIDASGSPVDCVQYRLWPTGWSKSSYQAVRRYGLDANYENETILDNPTGLQTGGSITYEHSCQYFHDWDKSSQITGYYGKDYQHRWGTGTGAEATVRWSPRLFKTGQYKVYMRWPANSTYATAAKVTIKNALAGDYICYVNQTANGGVWNYLGQFQFNAGYTPSDGSVTISTYTTPTSKHVIADSVKLVFQY